MWTSPQELAFLEAREPLHAQAKATSTLSQFWDGMKVEWIDQFGMSLFIKQSTPGNPMGIKRLRQWYNNRRNTTNSTASKPGGRSSLAPKKQKYQQSQAYLKLYYSSKVAPMMEKEYPIYQNRLLELARGTLVEFPRYQESLRIRSNDVDTGRLAFMNTLARHMVSEESEEVKAEVAYLQENGDEDEIPAYLELNTSSSVGGSGSVGILARLGSTDPGYPSGSYL
ncbi:hypothetical protein BD410DRAFT_846164 [Rickenella mellea]|uniref:Uncharacterized protein n=1 Tax=Rickenella mellea TaxID=50990 RepID=A0A4Y7PG51_9AGAM|nr:hypothetical protein BD410DRAFT_846164 [Rickenella mellea]